MPILRFARLAPPPDETADAIFLVTHEVSRHRPAVSAVLAALRALFRKERDRLQGTRQHPRQVERSKRLISNHLFTGVGA